MTTLRIHRATAYSPVTSRLRIHQVTASGTVSSAGSRLRIHRVSVSGLLDLRVTPPASRSEVEPASPFTLVATANDDTGVTWTWRQVSGAPVTLTSGGAAALVTAPYLMPTPRGDSPPEARVVLGVAASTATATAVEQFVTLDIAPWPGPWVWNGSALVGGRLVVAPKGGINSSIGAVGGYGQGGYGQGGYGV